MKYFKSNKMFSYLFALSSVLLAVACITISSSFAFPDDLAVAKNWNVYFANVDTDNENGSVQINNDRLNINVSLNENTSIYKFVVDIRNDGDFDTKLSDVYITNLSSIEVGKSNLTGIIYNLSDYVEIYTKYYIDNPKNNVLEGANYRIGDLLNKNTKNRLSVSIKYKDSIKEDALNVLNNALDENNTLNFSLSLDVNYKENSNK